MIYGCRRGMYKHGHNLDPAFQNVALMELMIAQITFPGSCASWWKPFEVFKPYGTIFPENKTQSIFISLEQDYMIKKGFNHIPLSLQRWLASGVPVFSICTTVPFHDCFLFFPHWCRRSTWIYDNMSKGHITASSLYGVWTAISREGYYALPHLSKAHILQ